MYLISSVWFQWRQHSVVRPEHWLPIEQWMHLLSSSFCSSFAIKTSDRHFMITVRGFVGHLFFFDSLPIGFTMQRCVRSFSSQKREEPLVRPRNDDVWELNECGNSILYWWRATAPIWLVVPRGKFASAKLTLATIKCELLITGQENSWP